MSDAIETHRNDFPIEGFHHIEFWVGNAYEAAHYYRAIHGYEIVGYRGPETGVRHRASYALRQNDVRFVFSGALDPSDQLSDHLKLHGPGVRDVAIQVPDAETAHALAVSRGAESVLEPTVVEGDRGKWKTAAIKAYGDTIHSLVENPDMTWPPPDFRLRDDSIATPIGLDHIDHVVANVELGAMDRWVEFYERVFGFVLLRHFDDQAISTEYSALMSKVAWDGSGVIRLRSTSRRPGGASRRSRSTSTTTTAPACSTSPSPPTT